MFMFIVRVYVLIYECNQLLRIVAGEVVFLFAFVSNLYKVVPTRGVNLDKFCFAEIEEAAVVSEKSYSGEYWYH